MTTSTLRIERTRYKERRRLNPIKIRKFVERLRGRCERSDASLRMIAEILAKTKDTESIERVLQAIRNKN